MKTRKKNRIWKGTEQKKSKERKYPRENGNSTECYQDIG